MATDTVELAIILPMDAQSIYESWLRGELHTAMTGSPATGEVALDASFTAWGGYIQGQNLELEPGKRIVQSWRTTDFPEGAPDSRLELIFTEEGYETKVLLKHSEIPKGQGTKYEQGWEEHYFAPMRRYFAVTTRRTR